MCFSFHYRLNIRNHHFQNHILILVNQVLIAIEFGLFSIISRSFFQGQNWLLKCTQKIPNNGQIPVRICKRWLYPLFHACKRFNKGKVSCLKCTSRLQLSTKCWLVVVKTTRTTKMLCNIQLVICICIHLSLWIRTIHLI